MSKKAQDHDADSVGRRARKTYYRYGHESPLGWFERVVKFGVGKLLGRKWSYQLSRRVLSRRMERESSLKDVLETAYHFKGYGEFATIRPRQVYDEISELAQIVQDHDPETVLEIGTDMGGTFYIWCRILNASDIISIDLPEAASGFTRQKFLKEIRTPAELSFIRQNAHSNRTVEAVQDRLDGDELDFLFLDCDFRYEYVKRDFEYYRPLMADDGVIALHDVANAEGGAIDFWKEVKENYETEKVVSTPPRRPYDLGVGVIHL